MRAISEEEDVDDVIPAVGSCPELSLSPELENIMDEDAMVVASPERDE